MTAKRMSAPGAGGGRGWGTTAPPVPADYDRLKYLYEVQTVLAQASGIEQACDALLRIVTRALRVRTAVLLDVTGHVQRVFMWAAAGLSPVVVEEAREHARKLLEDLAPAGINPANVVSRATVLAGGIAEQAIVPRHFVTLPLSLGHGNVFGVFQLEGAIAFDEQDLLFSNAVSSQLAVALRRHHTRQELEAARLELHQTNRWLRDLQAIADAALEGTTLDESLYAMLRELRSTFSADAAALLLASTDGRTLRCHPAIGLKDADGLEIPVGAGAAGRIAASGRAMFFDDLDDPEGMSPIPRSNGIRSLLGAPMRARNRLTGVVYVASRGRRGFAYDELRLLELVADRIGAIVDNARLYERTLAAVRSRDAVMGAVSHDLRNPLGTILNATALFPAENPRITEPVAIIKRSVDVMVRLISDLADIGSIEAGQLSIMSQPEDARALVRDAVDGVRDAASKKPVRLEVHLLTPDLLVQCDRIRIIQVFTNLLSNAIKFTPSRGSITISIADAEPGYARFCVADTGSGIPERDLGHVFERYWQARGTAHLGRGLGLAIAKGIVEAHGGTMWVESRVDHGTTFSFTLPLAREASALPSGPGLLRKVREDPHRHPGAP